MHLEQFFVDDDAVSPVIGVILMVAITVILATVVGTFALGLGEEVQTTPPKAQFTFDYTAGEPATLDITHDGGDTIDASELYVSGDVAASGPWEQAGISEVRAGESVTVSDSGAFDWDSSVTVDDDANGIPEDVEDGTEIRVIWQNSESDQSSTLLTWST